MQEAVSAATEALSALRHDLADAIASSGGNLERAKKAIAAVRKKYGNSNAIADALFVPITMADMAGRLMVYENEADGVVQLRDPARPVSLALGDSQPVEAFLNLPWEEAVQYIRERGAVDEDDLAPLLRSYTEQTKDARRALLAQIQARAYDLLAQAVERGETFEDFAEALASDADGLGITSQDPAYLQTVFRTNVLDAYGAGRAAAMNHPAVVEARPYRQIRTAGDARVREEHVPLDGLVYASDGPLKGLRPPFGFNCRCAVVSLPDWDGEVVAELPAGAVAPGFGGL